MEAIWQHAYENELSIQPEDHSVVHSEAPLTAKPNREKLVQIMFEKFNVPKVFVATTASLAIHSTGKLTGVILDVGEGITHAVPIYDGIPQYAIKQMALAGSDITDYLTKMLKTPADGFRAVDHLDIVRDIKENLACCKNGANRGILALK